MMLFIQAIVVRVMYCHSRVGIVERRYGFHRKIHLGLIICLSARITSIFVVR